MKVFLSANFGRVVEALRKAGYRRMGRNSRSFRKDKYHVILTEVLSGVIIELHKDTRTIRIDEHHSRHHAKYRGKDLKREMNRIRRCLQV